MAGGHGLGLRLKSAHHAYWLWLSNRIKWRKHGYRERPCGELTGLDAVQLRRIAELRSRYDVAFERSFDCTNALENYLYLDLLDRLRQVVGEAWPVGRRVLDVGSKNFYYAPVLHAALAPRTLTGLEVEGYRIYPNRYSRRDYAESYIADLPDTHFVVGDVRGWRTPVDLVTWFYPFVFADTLVAWYLPLRLFDPVGTFAAAAAALAPGGRLLMCNQGDEEAAEAAQYARAAGLERDIIVRVDDPLLPRRLPPVLGLWRAGDDVTARNATLGSEKRRPANGADK